ncbi:MAG: Uma2 family endonuclease [Gallionella sp.]|jgi:Uma2 family endonuclease
MTGLKYSRLTEADYLLGELASEIRHEYVDGEVFAMAGAGEAHNLIAGNIFAKLRGLVRGGPCRVYISDMKLRVKTWKAYYYPDVMVTCDPTGSEGNYKERPSLVVEVLSPSTERTDRREKMLAYRTLIDLREYLLVATDKQHVELYRRDAQDEWQMTNLNPADGIHLESLGYHLSLNDIYEDVKLDTSFIQIN